MIFRLLGRVEVEHQGCRLTMARRRDRAVLAVLLNDCGRIVTTDRLVSLLWERHCRPATARRAVQAHIARLRATLAVDPEVTITSAGTGYRIDVDPLRVDAHRFRSSLRAARLTPDLAARADLLRSGLELWRGPALSDSATGRLAGTLCLELTELHRVTQEEWFDTSLSLGRHRELCASLAGLAAEHPDRENLTRLAMLALYRCDRAAEALALFAQHRRLLDQEFGLEPGGELIELQRAILNNDPAVRVGPTDPAAVGSRPAPARIAQLPPGPPGFVGRRAELARLKQPGATVRVISGPPGTGTSALALRTAHELAPSFADGQFFVALNGMDDAVSSSEVLGRMLVALGIDEAHLPASGDERGDLYRSTLAGRRMLVLLDNARDEAQVRPLLPGTPGCLVIATSRNRLTGLSDAELIEVDELDPAEAMSMLSRIVGGERIGADRRSAERIVRQCGYLPLAIHLAGARLAARGRWPVSLMADRLADERQRLNELTVGDCSVRASIDLSYRALDPTARATLRRIGHLGLSQCTTPVVARTMGLSDTEADRVIEAILDAQLIQFVGVDPEHGLRYRLPVLVRIFARERAEAEDATEEPGTTARLPVTCPP